MNPVREEILQLIAERGPMRTDDLFRASELATKRLSVSQSVRQSIKHGELEQDDDSRFSLTEYGWKVVAECSGERAGTELADQWLRGDTPGQDTDAVGGTLPATANDRQGFVNTDAAREHRRGTDQPDDAGSDGRYLEIPRFLNERNRATDDRGFCCAVTSAGWFWLQIADQRIELTVDETRQMLDYLDRTLEPRGSES